MKAQETKTEVNVVAVAVLCGIILVLGAGIIVALFYFSPEAAMTDPPQVVPVVEVVTVHREDFDVTVRSQGSVEPRTETEAASEVSGRVVRVADNFVAGAQIKGGDVLVEIDPTQYEAAAAAAAAALADARLALELEEAKAAQSKRDWEALGSAREATPLTLREPQLESAAANVKAAEADLARARRDLAQTQLRAPYDGRIRSTSTDIGSYVTVGSPLAEMYATDVLEVRLPLSADDYQFVGGGDDGTGAEVTLSPGSGAEARWPAEVVRADGEIDRRTRTIDLVARVAPSAAAGAGKQGGILPGLFVEARIAGKTIADAVKLPRRALVGLSTVLVLNAENRLEFREVTIARSGTDYVIVTAGLAEGERVCITPLAAPVNGMEVQVVDPAGKDKAGAAGDPALAETPG